ncbi:MAG: flavin reductase [Chitinophagaceae bacterium]|nr:flavin reductase [Chitinophagaceae bacterium]
MPEAPKPDMEVKYQKGYAADYYFPARNTVGFQADKVEDGMFVRFLPPLPEDQVEVDDDKARWPCFFPSSLGMVTTWGEDGVPNLMPCGSTSVLIRHPLCFAICVSYAKINTRYAVRASLKSLLAQKKFVCGVPYANNDMVNSIKYAGNISIVSDPHKIHNAGLEFIADDHGPLLTAMPLSYRCNIVKIVRLGTHFLMLGEVESVIVRDDVTKDNHLKWYSYPDVIKVKTEQHA